MKTPSNEALQKLLAAAPAEFSLQPTTMLCILAALQLAFRHPDFKNTTAATQVAHFAAALEYSLSHIHPEIAQLCKAGWNSDETIEDPNAP